MEPSLSVTAFWFKIASGQLQNHHSSKFNVQAYVILRQRAACETKMVSFSKYLKIRQTNRVLKTTLLQTALQFG